MNKLFYSIVFVVLLLAIPACATTPDLSSCDPNVASYGRTLSGVASGCYEARQEKLAAIRADQESERDALEAQRESLLYETDIAMLTRSEQERELSKLQDDIERLRADIPVKAEASAERAAQAERLSRELDNLKKRVADLRASVKAADENIVKLREELARVLKSKEQVQLEIMALTETAA